MEADEIGLIWTTPDRFRWDGPVTVRDTALDAFEAHRSVLTGVAYRMLGRFTDAEDVVQEAWLRWSGADREDVRDVRGYLVRVTTRLAIDRLRQAQSRCEAYVGPWLPEPIASDPLSVTRPGPEEMAELASSLTLGFLHVLETLSPLERVVFVLADVFDTPFKEIAETVGRSPEACRQLASRARRRVREAKPRHYVRPDEEAARTVAELLAATTAGDVEGVTRLLADDVVLVSDGGAHHRAARYPVRGSHRVARLLGNLGRRFSFTAIEPVALNGELGIVAYEGDRRVAAMAVDVGDGHVRGIHLIVNDEKLAALDRPVDVV
jgi:RNA polymerase sigma-70 factor, ECF subfamily